MADTKIEKLTTSERKNLSREMLLKWYRAHRLSKLLAFQKELREKMKQGKYAELEMLKRKIIENTKRELSIHKKFTKKELEKRAREFADAIMKTAKGEKNIEEIVKKYSEKSKLLTRETLIQQWLEQNPQDFKEKEIPQLSPKFIAYRLFKDELFKKDAYIMFSLIENKWGLDTANKLLAEVIAAFTQPFGEKVARAKLLHFFREDNVRGRIAFYYGKNKRKYYWVKSRAKQLKLELHWYRQFHADDSPYINDVKYGVDARFYWNTEFWVQGWWAYDESPGEYDEYAGPVYLYHAIKKINSELTSRKNYDSGIPKSDAQEIAALLKDEKEESKATKSKLSRDLFSLFIEKDDSKLYKGRWGAITNADILGKMILRYGTGNETIDFENYKYRYFPSLNKIYFIKLNKAKVDSEQFGGVINVKEKKLDTIKFLNKKQVELRLNKAVKEYNENDIKEELLGYQIVSGKMTREQMLLATEGIAVLVNKTPLIRYDKIDDYFARLKDAIKEYIKKDRKISDKQAEKLAIFRSEDIREKVDKKINKDEILKEILDEDPEEPITININSKDEVRVKPKNTRKYKKLLSEKMGEIKGAVTKAEDFIDRAYASLEKRFGPVITWIIDLFVDIKKMVKKATSGTAGLFEKIAIGFLGLGGVIGTKAMIGTRKVNEEILDNMAKLGRKIKRLKNKMYFTHDIKLKGKKIVIPRGSGIIPGRSFRVEVKGVGERIARLKKKKEKGGFLSFLSRRKRDESLFKDRQITIKEGTRIPRGTIIPRGAKLIRT